MHEFAMNPAVWIVTSSDHADRVKILAAFSWEEAAKDLVTALDEADTMEAYKYVIEKCAVLR